MNRSNWSTWEAGIYKLFLYSSTNMLTRSSRSTCREIP